MFLLKELLPEKDNALNKDSISLQISSVDPSSASLHVEEICLDPERNSLSQQKEGPAPMHNTLFGGNGWINQVYEKIVFHPLLS